MTRKQKRMTFIAGGLVILGLSAILVLTALRDSIVFFFSPTEIVEKSPAQDQRIRMGGLVAEGSVIRGESEEITFEVTDLSNLVKVSFVGILPDLFEEGQGVVVEGHVNGSGVFVASEVLAKHDENYMPPEVADILKKSGQWQGAGG